MKCWRILVLSSILVVCLEYAQAQQRGSFNYAKRTGGEREGDLTLGAIAGISIVCVAAVSGLVVTFFFCFYVYRQQRQQDSINSSFDPSRRA